MDIYTGQKWKRYTYVLAKNNSYFIYVIRNYFPCSNTIENHVQHKW